MDDVTDKAEKIDSKLLDMLLRPSWLSGLIAVFAGLFVTVGVIAAFTFNNSQVQQQLVGLQNTTDQSTLTIPGEATPSEGDNSLQNSWPLLIFWGFTGLAVYFVVEAMVSVLRQASAVRKELDYVHTRRDNLLRSVFTHLFLRLLAVAVWLVFMEIFLKRIIPYSITTAHASASDLLSLSGLLYAILSFVVIAFGVHVNTILLRLAVRRPRVFSRTSYL